MSATAVTATAAGDTRLLDRLWAWLIPALLVPLVIAELGYEYGSNWHPWVLQRIDPGLLANDWFTSTLPHHPNAIRFLAWIGHLAPLPSVMLVLHLLVLFLLLTVTYRTCRLLFADWRVFLVAVFLFLRWSTGGLGGNGLWAPYLLPHNATVPVALLAFYFALRDRPVIAALVAGAATWMHVQLGAQTMLVLGLGMLLGWRRIGLRPMALAGSLYLLVAAPAIVPQWLFYVGQPSPLSASEFAQINAVIRQPHHLAPFSWAGAEYYRFLLVLLMAALAGRWRRYPDRHALHWFVAVAALCLIGTIFVEILPVKLVLKLQLFRVTIFVKFFAVLYAARFLLAELDEPGWLRKFCVLAILVYVNYTVIGICLALLIAWRQKRVWGWGMAVFAAGCIAGFAMVATASLGKPLPMFWHSFGMTTTGLASAALALAVLAGIICQYPRLVAAALLALVAVERARAGLPPLAYDHLIADEWYLFCRDVRAATPRDALVITPPHLEGFQMFAERAQVGDFKCFPFGERDMLEWKRRLEDLSGGAELRCSGWVDCASQLAGNYLRLREADFVRLAGKYGAGYVVAAHGQRLAFPELIRRGDYILYRVPLDAPHH